MAILPVYQKPTPPVGKEMNNQKAEKLRQSLSFLGDSIVQIADQQSEKIQKANDSFFNNPYMKQSPALAWAGVMVYQGTLIYTTWNNSSPSQNAAQVGLLALIFAGGVYKRLYGDKKKAVKNQAVEETARAAIIQSIQQKIAMIIYAEKVGRRFIEAADEDRVQIYTDFSNEISKLPDGTVPNQLILECSEIKPLLLSESGEDITPKLRSIVYGRVFPQLKFYMKECRNQLYAMGVDTTEIDAKLSEKLPSDSPLLLNRDSDNSEED